MVSSVSAKPAMLVSALLIGSASASPQAIPAAAANGAKRDVDTTYPYTGPKVPIGDWVDNTINGNGKGYPRLVEAPAVKPASSNPTNNINVVALSYVPNGMNVHFQTPFGLGESPKVKYGTSKSRLTKSATGSTQTYDRTPSCSEVTAITQCSQFFHNVQISNLEAGTTYYYQIQAANGTTASSVLSFTTALAPGTEKEFSVAVVNDMGYTNAQGTYSHLTDAVDSGTALVWHGGDLSYADDWYSGILPCDDSWPLCYNGTSSELPPGDYPEDYNTPLPAGEIPSQGSPRGGDMSVLYESNWDLWQQWMNPITSKVPYMTMPGNHEASCAEFDGANNIMTAYLNDDKPDSSAPKKDLNYYSCPPSQRNFTAYQNRFRMPGSETNGVGSMWYSFDYGLAHFVSLDGETDYAYSPEWPFIRENKGKSGAPAESDTYITDSGPFGNIDNNEYKENSAYQQIQWLKSDLDKVDRTKTPWVFVMSHRPMYSTEGSSYLKDVRSAFEQIMLDAGVDAYLAGHIHWYERLLPIGKSSIDTSSVVNNNTYLTNPGVSMTHIINGMAGNIESHSTRSSSEKIQAYTQVLDTEHYGFTKMTVHNSSVVSWEFVRGDGQGLGDSLTLIKRDSESSSSSSSGSDSSSDGSSDSSSDGSSDSGSDGSSDGGDDGWGWGWGWKREESSTATAAFPVGTSPSTPFHMSTGAVPSGATATGTGAVATASSAVISGTEKMIQGSVLAGVLAAIAQML
ncbi:hypothetical protein TD95_001328 [Thielaviopsis punctulata]|uniref:Purple acid phosphatase n=1 Tax=Thielaviopsis punctulata TaxID=72032 RepID=A0A0F4ZM71_9PEZI|nr:hypothetical protein TD95_001328 [Thielaviopsis punctulata]